ncbi:MAG: hypothetical protein MUF06_16205, partial [Pirellulaceae bacterium]|nr:hypothetical protein [Pirellulaceae bacterium]
MIDHGVSQARPGRASVGPAGEVKWTNETTSRSISPAEQSCAVGRLTILLVLVAARIREAGPRHA